MRAVVSDSFYTGYSTQREIWSKTSANFSGYNATNGDQNWGQPVVSIDDINGDGVKDLVVGSQPYVAVDYTPYPSDVHRVPTHLSVDYGQKSSVGKVRVLSGKDGAFIREFSVGAPGDLFGYAVAGAYVNQDAIMDIVVGAPGTKVGTCNVGKVYVFDGATGAQLAVYGGDAASCPSSINNDLRKMHPSFGYSVSAYSYVLSGVRKSVIAIGEPGFGSRISQDRGRVALIKN